MYCKMCGKFKPNLNEEGVCERCQTQAWRKSLHVTITETSPTKAVPHLSDGRIAPKAQWLRLARKIDAYYSSVSIEDVEAYNEQARILASKRRQAAVRTERSGFIYLLGCDTGAYKIGRAIDIDIRLGQHLRNYPVKIWVTHTFFVSDAATVELFLLRRFATKRLQGEWFQLDPEDVTWFCTLDADRVKEIIESESQAEEW